MVLTTGVLPVPPTLKLPTLMTGRASCLCAPGCLAYHRRRARATELKRWLARFTKGCCTPGSMRRPEGHHDAAAASLGRHHAGNRGEAAVARAPVGLHERPSGGAEPCAPHRIAQERDQRRFQLAVRLHLNRVAESVARLTPERLRKRGPMTGVSFTQRKVISYEDALD